jgi:hypothetical protein
MRNTRGRERESEDEKDEGKRDRNKSNGERGKVIMRETRERKCVC